MKELHADALKTQMHLGTPSNGWGDASHLCKKQTNKKVRYVQPTCSKGSENLTRSHSQKHLKCCRGVLHWPALTILQHGGEKSVFTTAIASTLSLQIRLLCLTCASAIGHTHQFLTFASALKYQFQIYLS